MAESVGLAGLAVGAVSLTIQLLDGCVKGYQYFITAAGMPDECKYMRTRLLIEYSRLLDWSAVAGLTDHKDGQDLPGFLKPHRFVLIAILTEIRSSMDDLAHINGKYIELQPAANASASDQDLEVQLAAQFAEIQLSYHKEAVVRTYPRGLNHIARGSAMAKEMLKHPKRLQWVAFDGDVFKNMLGRLTTLNDHLHEMMHDQHARMLEAATQKTFLEMVQVRATVEELKQLMSAALMPQEHHFEITQISHRRQQNEQHLASLAAFKTLNARSDETSSHQPPSYNTVISSTQLQYSQMEYPSTSSNSTTNTSAIRTLGKCIIASHNTRVWIEWKTYKSRFSRRQEKDVPLKENSRRVRELVALLQSEKPVDFRTPRCLGYFDDRGDSAQSMHAHRFGLVYELPTSGETPISLHDLIAVHSKPSLTSRMILAHKMAQCLLYLHAVNWLHKAFRSDNILFFEHGQDLDLINPYLTGYEYARPDKDGETTVSTQGGINQWSQLYVHPNYQGSSAKGTYRKTFDIYSLGIVLLEIAYWKHIEEIVEVDPETAPEDLKHIRDKLLEPEGKYLSDLRENHGDRFCTAVSSCLEGRTALGIGEQENEMHPDTGARLQREFADKVVDAVEAIRI